MDGGCSSPLHRSQRVADGISEQLPSLSLECDEERKNTEKSEKDQNKSQKDHTSLSSFTLKEPNSCFSNNTPIRISTESTEFSTYRNLEIMGDFQQRSCTIVNSKGDVIAQIGVKEEVERMMSSRDLYRVRIKAGIDQAFVFGVIAVLDYIYDGSTRIEGVHAA